MYHHQAGFVSRTTLISLVSIIILLSLAFLFLPSGFSNDISQIGKGNKVAVFAYNNGTTNSGDMMHVLGNIREAYSDKIIFLAVSVSAPIGEQFLKDYNAEQSTLLLFNENGSKYGSLAATNNELTVKQALDAFLQK